MIEPENTTTPYKSLSFDALPEAIGQLLERVAHIEKLLTLERQPVTPTNELLSIIDAAAFLRLTKSTIYSKVCRGELPAYKTGRRLFFDKQELNQWIKSSRNSTNEVTRKNAERYVNSGKLMPVSLRRAYRVS